MCVICHGEYAHAQYALHFHNQLRRLSGWGQSAPLTAEEQATWCEESAHKAMLAGQSGHARGFLTLARDVRQKGGIDWSISDHRLPPVQ